MQYQYTHDADSRTVYRYPVEPVVTERRGGRKKELVGWHAHMQVNITRADNRLENRRWKYPHTDYPSQEFDARYSRQEVISYFFQNHSPPGVTITEEEYVRLQAEYETSARGTEAT